MLKKVGIIGAGSWGTALAIALANKGHQVTMWSHRVGHVQAMLEDRENIKYLPGIKFPNSLKVVGEIDKALSNVDTVVFSVPAQSFRSTFEQALPYISDDTIVVNVAKGIEKGSLLRLSEIAEMLKPGVKYVVLSGPSHAEEVGRQMPTTLVAASDDIELAKEIQNVFSTNRLRIYVNNDVCGTELGGALKNIIALGAGISDGIGFGDNAKAALMTRGLTEICRLGRKLGASMETFSGLTGIGDLIVTCGSMHSRNRRCGILIGEGMKPSEAVERIGMVVEGMSTVEAAYLLAQQVGVEMPITECIYRCINEEISPEEAVNILMSRDRKPEADKFMTLEEAVLFCEEHECEECPVIQKGLDTRSIEEKLGGKLCCENLVG